MTAVALAVNGAGLADWFGNFYGSTVPRAAQEVLSATEQKTLEGGPIAFTVKETLADGHIVYLTVEAKTADGSPACCTWATPIPPIPIGETMAAALDTPGVAPDTPSPGRADRQHSSLQRAGVDEPHADLAVSAEMMDAAYREDGSILLFDMLSANPARTGSALAVDITPTQRSWTGDAQARKAAVGKPRTHAKSRSTARSPKKVCRFLRGEAAPMLTVTQVHAEQTARACIVTVSAAVDGGLTLDDVMFAGSIHVLDAQGNKFPTALT
jgi:hypothetical protein